MIPEESQSGIESEGGDLAQGRLGPAGSAFTRHEHSFTAVSRADDGSIGTALLYTGGITAMALALALGSTHGRPTPRRRLPEVPAPAYSRVRRHGR